MTGKRNTCPGSIPTRGKGASIVDALIIDAPLGEADAPIDETDGRFTATNVDVNGKSHGATFAPFLVASLSSPDVKYGHAKVVVAPS